MNGTTIKSPWLNILICLGLLSLSTYSQASENPFVGNTLRVSFVTSETVLENGLVVNSGQQALNLTIYVAKDGRIFEFHNHQGGAVYRLGGHVREKTGLDVLWSIDGNRLDYTGVLPTGVIIKYAFIANGKTCSVGFDAVPSKSNRVARNSVSLKNCKILPGHVGP
jgi:hypothetical protein